MQKCREDRISTVWQCVGKRKKSKGIKLSTVLALLTSFFFGSVTIQCKNTCTQPQNRNLAAGPKEVVRLSVACACVWVRGRRRRMKEETEAQEWVEKEGREGLGAGLVAGLEISWSRKFKNELNYGSEEREALNLLC